MLTYVIKMMTGEEFIVSEETVNHILSLGETKGLVAIKELKGVINLSSVSLIIEELDYLQSIEKTARENRRIEIGNRINELTRIKIANKLKLLN